MRVAAPDAGRIAADPLWLPHRYDEAADAVHFIHLEREEHRAAIFLTDEYIHADVERVIMARAEAVASAGPPTPLHFIFHSAYCCSTLLARALDVEGVAMGLKEPVILNDMVGWMKRGAAPHQLKAVLDNVLTLLAQPFLPGEAVVVKPSNILNSFAEGMLDMRPQSRALLLHAPLPVYLRSVAKKGLWGRLWVRELFIILLEQRLVDLGLEDKNYLDLTDLQIAAAGWLAQQALFARLVERFGAERIRTLDSGTLMERPAQVIAGLSELFGLGLDEAAASALVTGPAFTRHSKFDTDFTSKDRAAEQRDAAATHGDEIEKVSAWAEAVAAAAGIRTDLPAPLI
ncbi:MAG: hypothetical protein H0W74_00390 [Sphingosinicella sp.]|nr:hypothetical protein [Sphingosinicella sp.]